jgi:hypothetical protein
MGTTLPFNFIYKFELGNLNLIHHLGTIDVHRKIILNWKKIGMRIWIGFKWLRMGSNVELL